MKKKSLLLGIAVVAVCLIAIRDCAPGQPESATPYRVYVDGFRLKIQYVLDSGRPSAPVPYKIKGICWSPASIGSPTEGGDLVTRRQEMLKWYSIDIPLMSEMGANTVRVYHDLGLNEDALAILDEFDRQGIKVIVTVGNGIADMERIESVVRYYRDHPAILMWALGNEWDYNLYYGRFSTVEEARAAIESAAQLIKELDSNHPV